MEDRDTKFANNVTRFLESRKVQFQVFTYSYGPETHSAGAVAEAIGWPPDQVFKTLVTLPVPPGRKPVLAVIPGPESLDLKALARAVGAKKMQMASHDQAEEKTTLLAGGISPLALVNRGFTVVLDERAQRFDTIVVSAGERGAQVALPVRDLVRLTGARWASLT
jgi:Cys-tRNA(Pro)/Cys-tRNA(Cys) deacylase